MRERQDQVGVCLQGLLMERRWWYWPCVFLGAAGVGGVLFLLLWLMG